MLFPNDENLRNSANGFERTSNHKFKDASERFTLGSGTDYQKQYSHIYSRRLNEMRPLLAEKATEKWGNTNNIHLFAMALNLFILLHRRKVRDQETNRSTRR